MVEVHDVADFDAVWLPWWRRAKVRAYTAKKSKKKVCSDYLFENSCNLTYFVMHYIHIGAKNNRYFGWRAQPIINLIAL